jgi:hypothetical protein
MTIKAKKKPASSAKSKKSVSKTKALRRAIAKSRIKRHHKPREHSVDKNIWDRSTTLWPALVTAVLLAITAFVLFTAKGQKSYTYNKPVSTYSQDYVMSREFTAAPSSEISERIAYWSDLLFKNPDMVERLRKIHDAPAIQDSAPLVPYSFNCTTYVETVAALSRSAAEYEFYNNVLQIRYKDAKPTFFTRNHFPSIDWIPNNQTAGILTDITHEVAVQAGIHSGVETKVIDHGKWFQKLVRTGKVSRSIASQPDEKWSAPVEAKVSYIPVADMLKTVDSIPSGSVLNIVRRNNPRQPVVITHQGFLIKEGGKAFFRHSTPNGSIRSVPFAGYFQVIKNSHRSTWPVLGFNVNRIEPSRGLAGAK